MRKTKILFSALFALSLIVLAGCSKEKDAEEISPEEKEAIMEIAMEYLFLDTKILGDALNNGGIFQAPVSFPSGLSTLNPGSALSEDDNTCPMVSIESEEETSMTVLVDYGSGCTDLDGVRKSGQIELHYSIDFDKMEMLISLNYSDFGFGIYTINGTYDIRQKGETEQNFDGNYTITKEGSGATKFEITANTSRNDDGFVYNANASAVSTRNNKEFKWKYKFEEPGIMPFDCDNFTSGLIKFTHANGKQVGSLDFGDGECDNEATLTVNGKTETIYFEN